LICLNGFVQVNGCASCKCLPSPPCVCGPKPLFEILCPDKIHYAGYTNVCTRINGACEWVFQQCPIVINITISSVITVADIQIVLTILGIPNDPTIQILTIVNSNGYKTYEIVIPYALKPTSLTDSQLIIKLEAALIELFKNIHVTIKVIQTGDAVIDKNALSNMASSTSSNMASSTSSNMASSTSTSTSTSVAQSSQSNGDGRLIIFMGILAILSLLML